MSEQTENRQPARSDLTATCALCGQTLEAGRDDLYAELCHPCELRSLKGRQRRGRRAEPRHERFSKTGRS